MILNLKSLKILLVSEQEAADSGVSSYFRGNRPRAPVCAKFRAKFIKVHGRKLGGDLELGIAWNAGQEPNNDAYHSREFNAQEGVTH